MLDIIICIWHLELPSHLSSMKEGHKRTSQTSCDLLREIWKKNLGPYWDFYLPEPNTQTLSQEEGTSGSGCRLCVTFLLVKMLEPAFLKHFFWPLMLSLWCCANLSKALWGILRWLSQEILPCAPDIKVKVLVTQLCDPLWPMLM